MEVLLPPEVEASWSLNSTQWPAKTSPTPNFDSFLPVFFPRARWGSLDFSKGATPSSAFSSFFLLFLLLVSSSASSDCGQRTRAISRAPDAVGATPGPEHMPYRMSDRMSEHMPGSMSDIVTEYMPERMSDRMSELFIYIWLYMYKGHRYFKMICQKLCPDSVSGWGSLEIRQFKHFCVGGLCLIYTHNIYIYLDC